MKTNKQLCFKSVPLDYFNGSEMYSDMTVLKVKVSKSSQCQELGGFS